MENKLDYISRSKFYDSVRQQAMQHWEASAELKPENPTAAETEARIAATLFGLAAAIRDA